MQRIYIFIQKLWNIGMAYSSKCLLSIPLNTTQIIRIIWQIPFPLCHNNIQIIIQRSIHAQVLLL